MSLLSFISNHFGHYCVQDYKSDLISKKMAARSKWEQAVASFDRELHNHRNWFVPPLVKLENMTAIKRNYLAIGFIALLALYLCIGCCAEFVCNLIAFAWPAFLTLKSADSRSKEGDIKWLVYWVIYGFLSLMEFFDNAIANLFPPYFLVKVLFMMWLVMPVERNGSHIIYHRLIYPIFSNQFKFDDFYGSAVSSITNAAQSTMEGARKLGKNK